MYNIQLSASNLRRALANIELLYYKEWLIDGGFAFFSSVHNSNKESGGSSLVMNYSPINQEFFTKNIEFYLSKEFPSFNKLRRNKISAIIKGLIAKDRSFEVLHHAKQNKSKLQEFGHYTMRIPHGLGSNSFNKILEKIIQKSDISESEINDLDLFFLKEGTSNFLKIPLPFLSTPTILLVINDICKNDYERAKLIRLVFYSTREALYNYIYNILVNNLQGLLTEDSVSSLDSLVINFVKEVCKVLLPVRILIKKGKEGLYAEDYITEWQVCDKTCNSKFEVFLKAEESEGRFISYSATFFLTSFHFPIKKQEIAFDGLIVRDGYTTEWIHKIPGYELFMEQTQQMLINIFNLIYKQWKKNVEAKDHATKAATSRIINRNYAHHIGSHVSHRATADKIFERLYGSYDLSNIPTGEVDITLKSIVEMENRLTRYKDERNEFISGIDSNTHPVPVLFYRDIIQPFVENSLLMDNIAKSEGICWESDKISKNDGKVKEGGICKLRIRVFYHKGILERIPNPEPCSIKECCCKRDIPCMHKSSEEGHPHDRLSLSDLEIDKDWYEMMAIYDLDGSSCNKKNIDNNKEKSLHGVCIHRLPYYKKLAADGNGFYQSVQYSLDDLEVAIPGTLGTHSIFSLLENQIRNTAKHASTSTVGSIMPVNIIIKISKRIDKNAIEDPDFYNMELTSNIPTIHDQDQKSKILKGLQEPIDIDTKALGFADMRINASLLAFREIKQETLDMSIEEPRYYPKNAANGQSISFCMQLTRPCKVVFIGEAFRKFRTSELEKRGIRQFDTASDCIKSLGDTPRAFQFAVLKKEIFDEIENIDLLIKSLPWRVLVSASKEECNESLRKLIELRRVTPAPDLVLKENDQPEGMLEKCWNSWLRYRWKPPYTLNIFFDNNKSLDHRYGSKADKMDENLSFSFQLGSGNSVVFEKNNSFDVFYDRHGNFRDNINANLHKKSLLQLSWEYFDKNNPDSDLIHNDQLNYPEISFSKLLESGIHKILVIDERAREEGLKSMSHLTYLGEDDADESGENNPYLRFAMAARVYIADSFLIDGEEVLYETGATLSKGLEKFFQVSLKSEPKKQLCFNGRLKSRIDQTSLDVFSKFDTLIIHRTMLSKVDAKGLFSILGENFPNIIITTGGGTLKYEPEIMNRTRMLPYAAVKKYLLNGAIAKNCITNLI